MPRDGTDAQVKWYDINPCYVFHPMNSCEDGDKIILDVTRYSHIRKESTMDFPQPELWRWTIDTTRGVVHAEQIDGRSAEFPRVADSVTGLKHRYGYLAGASPETDPMDASGAILKYDRNTGTRTDIEFGRGRIGGEPVFVPSENAKSEDDGYLMTYVYDAKTDSSSFVIMDAATMDNSPIASIELPRIPSGFHGNWIDAKIAN